MTVTLAKPLAVGTVARVTDRDDTVHTCYITKVTEWHAQLIEYETRSIYTGRAVAARDIRVIHDTRIESLMTEARGWLADCDLSSSDPLRQVRRYYDGGLVAFIQALQN